MFARWLQLGRRRPSIGDPVWDVLARTGNGIGGAPQILRALPTLDEEGVLEVVCSEFDTAFLHQYTVYAATPFALDIVLGVLLPDQPGLAALLEVVRLCLEAEGVGPALPSHAGEWFPAKDRALLASAGIERPTIAEVIARHQRALEAIAERAGDAADRKAAAELIRRAGAAVQRT